jgi:hypothetical protein
MSKLLVVIGLALLVVLSGAPIALADDTTCVGFVTGPHDNIVAPPGALCIVSAAQVKGNIKALENSRLVVFNVAVGGSIDGDKVDSVQIVDSLVGGNIQIKEGGTTRFLFSVLICQTFLPNGNIVVEKMSGGVIVGDAVSFFFCPGNTVAKGNISIQENVITTVFSVRFNNVSENLQVFKNTGAGPKFVQFNTAGESVQCTDNAPPFVGSPNNAPKKEGQCPL